MVEKSYCGTSHLKMTGYSSDTLQISVRSRGTYIFFHGCGQNEYSLLIVRVSNPDK